MRRHTCKPIRAVAVYSQAIHWGSPPVVRRQWLLDSASAGSALPYDAYMVIAAHEAANEEPNLSSGQHCGPVSCSTNPMLLDTEPELITARVCRCSPAGPDSALASARHATPTPVAPHAQNQPAADGVVSGNVVNNKQDSRSAKAQSSLEPERRRAVAHSAAADAFGLDDLQPLHSPGAQSRECCRCCSRHKSLLCHVNPTVQAVSALHCRRAHVPLCNNVACRNHAPSGTQAQPAPGHRARRTRSKLPDH